MGPCRGFARTVRGVAVRSRTSIARPLGVCGHCPTCLVRRSTATTSRVACSFGRAVAGSTGMVSGTTASGRIMPAVGATRDALGQVP